MIYHSTTTTEDDDTNNTTNFIMNDNSSEIARAKTFPDHFIEPLVIIAKIEGYKGIDDYVIHLIKDRLEMFTDTRDELGESFQKYMHNTIKGKDVPNEWASNNKDKEENDDTNASEFVKQVHEGYNDLKKTEDKEKEDLR